MNWIFGGRRGGVIPGSMPNPAVKPSIADGTAEAIRGRAGRRRKSCLKEEQPPRNGRLLVVIPTTEGRRDPTPRDLNPGPLRRFAPQGKRTTRTGKTPVRSPACVIPSATSSRHPDDRREEGSYSARPQPWAPSSLRSSGQANDTNKKCIRSVACLCHPDDRREEGSYIARPSNQVPRQNPPRDDSGRLASARDDNAIASCLSRDLPRLLLIPPT